MCWGVAGWTERIGGTLAEGEPQRALQTEYHLACFEGPDRGAVVPLEDGLVIGRGPLPGLRDPALSRAHCRVELEAASHARGRRRPLRARPVGYLHDLSATNPLRLPWGARLRAAGWPRPAPGLPLRPGAAVRLGSGKWRVRQRPADLQWPSPPQRPGGGRMRGGWLRALPLVMVALLVARFLPWGRGAALAALAVGGAVWLGLLGWRRRERRKLFDPAFLQLAVLAELLARAAGTKPRGEAVPVWLNRWGKKTVEVAPGAGLGVVGENAHGDARWLAAQIWLASPGLSWFDDSFGAPPTGAAPWLWVRRPTSGPGGAAGGTAADAPEGTVTVAWGASTTRLPPTTRQIVSPQNGTADTWLLSLDDHDRTRPHLGAALPAKTRLVELGVEMGVGATERRWRRFPSIPHASRWAVPVGTAAGATGADPAVFSLDIRQMGPHALLAGGTGSGKSVALLSWLWSLCLHVPPSSLRLLLIDYKGGAGLGKLAALPHVEKFVTDLEPSETAWVLRRLKGALQKRKRELQRAGFADLSEWEAGGDAGPAPPRLLVVIDEFQTLGEEHPQLLDAVTRLAAQGRSLGLHLLLATQRPGHTVNANLRATLDLRVALYCTEAADSIAIRGDDKAAALPRVPGRALYADREFQFALPGPVDSQAVLRARSAQAAGASLWPAPLPKTVTAGDVAAARAAIPGTPPGIVIGLREGARERGGPAAVLWQGEPLLLAGPAAARGELSAQAQALGLRAAAESGVPAYLIGQDTLRLPSGAPCGWQAVLDPAEAGTCAWALSQTLRRGGAVVVVCGVADLLQEFDLRGVGLEANMMWDHLVGQAGRRGIRLIASETGSARKVGRLPAKLFRIPRGTAWTDPMLLPLLPGLASLGDAPDDQAPSREEAVSALPGRVLATGFSDWASGLSLPPTMLQLAQPEAPAAGSVAGGSDVFNGPAEDLTVLAPGRAHLLGVAPAQRDWLRSRTGPAVEFTEVDRSQWFSAMQDAATPLFVGLPPLEWLRYLASHHPQDEVWLKANYPYSEDLLLFRRAGSVALLRTGSDFAPSPIR